MENTKSQPISPQSKACRNPNHALADGTPSPHEIGPSCMAESSNALRLLALMYDRWEDGAPCYEDVEVGFLGNAVKLSAEEEDEIIALLKGIPRAALSSPSTAICFLCQHPLHLVGGCSQCTCLEDSIVKNHKGVCPDCSICGKPSPLGNVCGACEAAKMHGYKMEVDEISGAKSFKDWATHHFCEGFRTGQKVILKERMDAITASPSPTTEKEK